MKRLRYYQLFRGVFADLKTFRRELRALCKPAAFKTEEVKEAYDPVAATLTTYMQSLDRQEGHPEDLYLAKDDNGGRASTGGKLRGYLERARQIVRETRGVKVAKGKLSKVAAASNPEEKDARKRRLFRLFSKQLKRVVEIMKQMNLTPAIIVRGDLFGKTAFSSGQESRDFFKAVKEGDIVFVKKMLRINRFLIYEYDDTK